MHYFDTPDPHRIFKVGTIMILSLLTSLIIVLALTNNDQPPANPPPHAPAPATIGSDSTEEAIPLADGRTVLCLVLPGHQVSCDWATVRAR